MNKKLIVFIILILFLIAGGAFLWWQNDKNTTENIESNKENFLIPTIETIKITGKVIPPSNIKPESLTIVTLGEITSVDTKGNFYSDVHKEGVTLMAAMPQHKDFGLMNVVVTLKDDSDILPILDSKTTAESMVFITPYFLTSHSQKANEILEVIRNDAKVNILAEVIEDVFNEKDPLGNSNLQEAFKDAVESVVNELSYQQSVPLSSGLDKNNSEYKIIRLPKKNIDQNFLYQKIFSFAQADTKKWQPAILQPDPDYMQINISQNEESCNMSAESKKFGAVDWICELSNLDINEEGFDIMEFYEKAKDNRTTYQSENFNGSGNIGTIYVKAKGVFKYLDYMSYIVDNVSDKIFGKKTKHTFDIPINDDGIYLVRCYSGGWGILTNDPNERSFIGQQAKFYDTKQNRTNDALVSNVAMIFFDGMNVLIRYDSLPLGDVSEILMAGLMIDSSEIVISEGLQTKDDLFRTFYRVVTQVSENMVKRTAKAIKAEISRNLFFGLSRMGKMVVRIAWPVDKIIAGGQIADRANQMITIATPLETSYIIVGDPLLEEKLSKDEKGNYEEVIIGGTFLEPPGNFKIKYLDTIWRLNEEEENFPKLEHKTIDCRTYLALGLEGGILCMKGGPGYDFIEEETELNLNNKNFKRDIRQIKNGTEIEIEYYFNSSFDFEKIWHWHDRLHVSSNQNDYKQCMTDFEELLKTLEFTEEQEKQEESKEENKYPYLEQIKEIAESNTNPKQEEVETKKEESIVTAFVINQYNEAVEKAEFWLVDKEGNRYGYFFTYGRETIETGYLETVPVSDGEYTLYIEKINYDTYKNKIQIIGSEISLGEIIIHKWSKVTAFIVDQYGEPVNGAEFWLIDQYGKKYGYFYGGRRTSVTGYLETVSIPSGEYKLCLRKYNYPEIKKIKLQITDKDISLGEIVCKKPE